MAAAVTRRLCERFVLLSIKMVPCLRLYVCACMCMSVCERQRAQYAVCVAKALSFYYEWREEAGQ